MLCPKCKHETEEGSLFCSACGVRLDGRKTCPSCQKKVPADAAFCNYCGANLAAQSSSLLEEETERVPMPKAKKVGLADFKQLFRLLTVIFLLCSMALLLCSVFFTGATISVSDSTGLTGEQIRAMEKNMREDQRPTVVHYIIGEIKEIVELAKDFPEDNTDLDVGSLVTKIVRTSLTCAVQIGAIVLAVVCFVRVLLMLLRDKKRPVRAFGPCISVGVASFFALTLAKLSYPVFGNVMTEKAEGLVQDIVSGMSAQDMFSIGAASTEYIIITTPLFYRLCMIPALVCFAFAILFGLLGDEKFRKQLASPLMTVAGCVASVFAFLTFIFSYLGDISLKIQEDTALLSVYGRLSSFDLFHSVFSLESFFGNSTDKANADFNTAIHTSIVSCILTLLVLVLSICLLRSLLVALFSPDRRPVRAVDIVLGALLLLSTVGRTVVNGMLAASFRGYMSPYTASFNISGYPITGIVLSFILFIGMMIVFAMNALQNTPAAQKAESV